MLNRRSDKLELLRIDEAVALEKSIDKELIISSMESGIAKAAKSKFGSENEIKVLINRENGDIGIFRKLIIVEKPENTNLEISLDQAIDLNKENQEKNIGDEVLQPLPSFDFGRIAAQTAKQVISSNVREAERERQFNDFIDKKDTILSGIVKRLEFGNVIADLGRTEAIIQKNELIPRENIKAGDRIKAYCLDVRKINPILKAIVGKKVDVAIRDLQFSEKRITKDIRKTISSAVANAENNFQYDIDKLIVKEAYCGKKITMKRFRPRAKGRASPIIKPYSNLTIILTEKQKEKVEKR